jgi:hypothetical protein
MVSAIMPPDPNPPMGWGIAFVSEKSSITRRDRNRMRIFVFTDNDKHGGPCGNERLSPFSKLYA